MNPEDFELQFIRESDGEDSIGNRSTSTIVHRCPVKDLFALKKGDNVPFTPAHNGEPDVCFKRVTDKTVELVFHSYDGPDSQFMSAIDVVLTPDDVFSKYFGGGRYDYTYSLLLVPIKK